MAADKLPETRDRWVEDRVNSFLGRSGFGGGPGGYGGYGGPGRTGRP